MKIPKQVGARGFVLMISILITGTATLSAATEKPGPLERFFRSIGRSFSQHKSTQHNAQKQTKGTANPSKAGSTAQNEGSNAQGGTAADVSAAPSEHNTRSTSRALTKKGEDLPYGTPVPGRQGFVTSPFSPNSGYIDVRGFAPGTPVKDPYTGKVFLTP
jgi:hypothetical protein